MTKKVPLYMLLGMLCVALSKNGLHVFPGHNHLLTAGANDPSL